MSTENENHPLYLCHVMHFSAVSKFTGPDFFEEPMEAIHCAYFIEIRITVGSHAKQISLSYSSVFDMFRLSITTFRWRNVDTVSLVRRFHTFRSSIYLRGNGAYSYDWEMQLFVPPFLNVLIPIARNAGSKFISNSLSTTVLLLILEYYRIAVSECILFGVLRSREPNRRVTWHSIMGGGEIKVRDINNKFST
jgi:hypothetical protein